MNRALWVLAEEMKSASTIAEMRTFMSMWLSGANKVAGAARGLAAATVKREATRASKDAVAEGTKQVLDFWGAAAGAAAPKPKARPKPKVKAKAKPRKRR